MRHLVIGAGNMGRRHGNILQSIGDRVSYIDIGESLSKALQKKPNSVLICTPPETHLELIQKVGKKRLPLFVEKPVYTKRSAIRYPAISMVACNWRFCDHALEAKEIACCYRNADKMDMIHFVDWFWNRYGKPYGSFNTESIGSVDEFRWDMDLFENDQGRKRNFFNAKFSIYPNNISSFVSTTINKNPIIHDKCSMFFRQMLLWRETVRGQREQVNPIFQASVRTNFLLDLIQQEKQRNALWSRTKTTPLPFRELHRIRGKR